MGYHIRFAGVVIAAFVLVVPVVAASPADQDGASRDASEYARMTGVSNAEAIRRMALQPLIDDLSAVLEVQEGPTFGGLYIDHDLSYRAVAMFTRDGAQTISGYVNGGPLAALVDVRTVDFTLAQLEADQVRLQHALDGADVAVTINIIANRVEVEVLSDGEVGARSLFGVDLPPSATVVRAENRREQTLNLYGGLALSTCTSGFSIYYGSNPSNRGITTAGHCGNSQSYAGNALTYHNDEQAHDNYDAQSHTKSGAAYPNLVQDSPGFTRQITAKRYWASQAVGNFVCKYGMTTGYGCGYIVSKNDPGCVGGSGNAYVKVDSDPNGTGYDLSEGGDSGGPWFNGGTAYGTMSCQQGYDGIYSSVGYVEVALGATILTSP